MKAIMRAKAGDKSKGRLVELDQELCILLFGSYYSQTADGADFEIEEYIVNAALNNEQNEKVTTAVRNLVDLAFEKGAVGKLLEVLNAGEFKRAA